MVLGAHECMNNADFETKKKKQKNKKNKKNIFQHCARCVYLSEITTRTSN